MERSVLNVDENAITLAIIGLLRGNQISTKKGTSSSWDKRDELPYFSLNKG